MIHVLSSILVYYKTGRSKIQKWNDRHFVIIRFFFRNLIMLPRDVFKSCNLSECCLYLFKDMAELKQNMPLPENGPLIPQHINSGLSENQ